MYNILENTEAQKYIKQLNKRGLKLFKRFMRRYERGRTAVPHGGTGVYFYNSPDRGQRACFMGACIIGGMHQNIAPFLWPSQVRFKHRVYTAFEDERCPVDPLPLFTGIPFTAPQFREWPYGEYGDYSALEHVITEIERVFDVTFSDVSDQLMREYNGDYQGNMTVSYIDDKYLNQIIEEATYEADKQSWLKLLELLAYYFPIHEEDV